MPRFSRATICCLPEPNRHRPSVNSASTHVCLHCLPNSVVLLSASLQASRFWVKTSDSHANLNKDRFDRGRSTPPIVGQKLHTHSTTRSDMTATSSCEAEKSRPNDTNEGRCHGVLFPEPQFQHHAFDVILLHILC